MISVLLLQKASDLIGNVVNGIPNTIASVSIFSTGCPKKIMRCLCGCCEGALDSITLVLYSCTSQASAYSLGHSMSQSGMWLLIYGREKAK